MNRPNDWNPFEQLKPLTSGLDELNQKEFVIPDWMSDDKAKAFYKWQPHLDLKENVQAYVMEFSFEDVSKDDIQLSINQDQLKIIAKRRLSNNEDITTHETLKEHEQVYQKSFHLPSFIDRDKISASYDNGRLSILLPKLSEDERIIEIN